MTPEQLPSGERRAPVEKYYARVDLGSARDVAKVLRAYGRILLGAPRDESREKLLRALRVDGIGPWVTTTVRTRSRLAIRMPSSTSGGVAGAGVAIAQPAQRRAEVGRDRGAATAEAPPFLRPLLRTQELAEGVD